jgi:hypothetical protein
MVLYFGDIIYHISGAYEVFLVNKSYLSDVMGDESNSIHGEKLDKLWCIKKVLPNIYWFAGHLLNKANIIGTTS